MDSREVIKKDKEKAKKQYEEDLRAVERKADMERHENRHSQSGDNDKAYQESIRKGRKEARKKYYNSVKESQDRERKAFEEKKKRRKEEK